MMSGQNLIFAPCCLANADGDRGFVEVADENGRPPEGGKIHRDAHFEPWTPAPVKFSTCAHEASHAVAALLAGQCLDHVAVAPIPRTGIMWHAEVSPAARAVVLLIGRHAANKIDRFRIQLYDAAWDWFRASSAAGSNGPCDFCQATDFARREAGDDGAIAWLREREGEALAILDDPVAWQAIRAVASALQERGHLSGKEVRSITRGAGLAFDAIDIDNIMETHVV